MILAGAHVASGFIHLAFIEVDISDNIIALPELFEKLTQSETQDAVAQQLFETKNRVAQSLRDSRVVSIGFYGTTKYSNWKYRDAERRVLAQSAIMIAAVTENTNFYKVKTTDAFESSIQIGVSKDEASGIGLDKLPRYWKTGGYEAYAAAISLVQKSEI